MNKINLEALNEEIIDKINTSVSKEMATQFLPKLIKLVKLDNENDLIRVNELVRLQSNTIQSRITNNSKTRFMNLVNMIGESRSTSLEMLKKTGKALEKLESDEKTKTVKKSSKKKLKKAA